MDGGVSVYGYDSDAINALVRVLDKFAATGTVDPEERYLDPEEKTSLGDAYSTLQSRQRTLFSKQLLAEDKAERNRKKVKQRRKVQRMPAVVKNMFVFESSSSPGTKYTTFLYSDGSKSCNCKGWTRRTLSDGSRSCKHTEQVDRMSPADRRQEAERARSMPGEVSASVNAVPPPEETKVRRKFNWKA
jgi:hypothetical protein